LAEYLPHISIVAAVNYLIVLFVLAWVLVSKKDSTAAMAWCLVVLLMPFVGTLLFWVFGHNHVNRPLQRKRQHRFRFREQHPPNTHGADRGEAPQAADEQTWNGLGRLALSMNAFPVSHGNAVQLHPETSQAFAQILADLRGASHHIHVEYFIFRPDGTGQQVLDILIEKAKSGVEVRLLVDSMGAHDLKWSLLRPLLAAGGKFSTFLPLNPLRSRIQVNLRNHRKIVVVDGRVAFTGGMNVGDEYLGKSARFGYWRDEVIRLEGPAVAGLQRVFVEDWDFATREALTGPAYFPELSEAGEAVVQVIESGPDQESNSIRGMIFAAILSARERLWIASPYFVPDSSLLDALRLARFRGVDVRLLSLLRPDHLLSFYAGRYYWADMLTVGAKVYQYRKGMMHAKLIMADGQWAMVGSANLDNRSLHLNFEAGCILHTPSLVAELEGQFRRDLEDASLLEPKEFASRSFRIRLVENASRLLSPIL
jgi:cardiolipin synthase